MKKAKGFTLIEILVTMVIIGILTTAATVSYEKARAKSRDTARKNDLLSISIALESRYAFEKNYPGDSDGCNSGASEIHRYNYNSRCAQPWIPGLSDYLDPLPIEKGPKVGDYVIEDNPCGDNQDWRVYQYKISTDNTYAHYHLLARLELSDSEATKNSTDCNASVTLCNGAILTGTCPTDALKTVIIGYPIYALYK